VLFATLLIVEIVWRRRETIEAVWGAGGMILTGENRSAGSETRHIDALSTRNTTLPGLRLTDISGVSATVWVRNVGYVCP